MDYISKPIIEINGDISKDEVIEAIVIINLLEYVWQSNYFDFGHKYEDKDIKNIKN